VRIKRTCKRSGDVYYWNVYFQADYFDAGYDDTFIDLVRSWLDEDDMAFHYDEAWRDESGNVIVHDNDDELDKYDDGSFIYEAVDEADDV